VPQFNSLLQKFGMVGVKFSTFALVLVLLAHGSMASSSGFFTYTPDATRRNMTGVVKAVDALKKACEPSWTASFPAKLTACVLAQGKTKKLCPQECGAFFSSVSGGECKTAVTEGARFVWPKNYKKIFQVCRSKCFQKKNVRSIFEEKNTMHIVIVEVCPLLICLCFFYFYSFAALGSLQCSANLKVLGSPSETLSQVKLLRQLLVLSRNHAGLLSQPSPFPLLLA
jgi:hypothetical protein